MMTGAPLGAILWRAARFVLLAVPVLVIADAIVSWVQRGQTDPLEVTE